MKLKLFCIIILAIFLTYAGALATMREEPSAWWKAESNQVNANLGTSAGSGDFNGDGYSDAVAGAWTYNNGESREGAAFVWYGSDSGLAQDGTPANADWMTESNNASCYFGNSVSTGDFNGDGFDDVIVGAIHYDNGQGLEGMVFVWYGSDSGLGPDGNPANADWKAESNQEYAQLGVHVNSGDFNGDGYDDVITGANRYTNGESNEGMIFVWEGSATGLGNDGTPNNADWKAESNQQDGSLGEVSSGDFNGDGYDDVIAGAYYYANPVADEGMIFMWEGSATGLGNDGTPDNADWKAESNQAYSVFGISVGSGDFNGDSYDDVVAGAYHYTNPEGFEGMVFAWEGSATGLGNDGTPDNADWKAESNQALACFGIVSSGDFNGDLYDDLIVGANNFSNPEYVEGMVFMWEGSATGLGNDGTPDNADWKAESNQEEAYLGRPVGSGDFDGDGCDDMIAGAHYYDNGETDEGMIFIWKGVSTGIHMTSSINITPTFKIVPNPVISGLFSVHYKIFSLKPAAISIILYDLSGRKVKTFLDEPQSRGIYKLRCYTSGLSSGNYFLLIRSRDCILQEKIVIIPRQF
jgi:hypothetical protein